MVVGHMNRHNKRLQANIAGAWYRIVLETAVVLASGGVGMLMLRKQMMGEY